ncbi:MAG: DUF1269 domain-containing protein [Actinomycetes bacterium]
MADEPVFLYLATYDSLADAQFDYEAVKALHKDHVIGTYDAAVITRDEHGHVHVRKHEKPTQHAAWTGLAVGAVIGIIFPPSILLGAAAGGLAGGLIGHFWKGMSRKDVMELGELLDDGEAALLIVGESALQSYVDKALTKARKRATREVDMESKVLSKELAEAARDAK